MMEMDSKRLAELALLAREGAYAPYSHFSVGAALLCADGTFVCGANIENAAYSVCNCAERTALFKAVSEGHRNFAALAVAGGSDSIGREESLPLCPPCGVCRQALAEFAGENLPILLVTGPNSYETTTLGRLFPMAFGPHQLNK